MPDEWAHASLVCPRPMTTAARVGPVAPIALAVVRPSRTVKAMDSHAIACALERGAPSVFLFERNERGPDILQYLQISFTAYRGWRQTITVPENASGA